MRLPKSLLLLTFYLLSLTVSVASAQTEVHPSIFLEREYTDNLFLDDIDPQTDWITTVEPGINFTYQAPSVDIALDYSLRFRFYQNHEEQNDDNFADLQRATSSALFFNGRPFTLRLTGTISRDSLDERDISSPSNELVNKYAVYNFTVAPEYRWQLTSTFSLVFSYLYDRTNVIDAAYDSEGHTGTFSVEKNLSTNTLFAGTYRYREQQADSYDNFNFQEYYLSLTQQFGPRVSLKVEGGEAHVLYDNGDDGSSSTWLASLTWQVSAPVSLDLAYGQTFSLSQIDGLYKDRSATVLLSYTRERFTSNLEFYWKEADYVRIFRQDQTSGARFDLRLMLTKVYFTDLNTYAERGNYKPFEEQIDRYGLGGGVGLEYRRVVVRLSANYRINDSDLPGRDYTENRFALSATVRF